jgi:hypothetical protein
MSPATASLFDVVAITAVVVIVAVVLLVALMRRAAAHPYRAVGYLLSEEEGRFLAALREALGGEHDVHPKVRLADIIDVRKGLTRKQRAEALERIASRHLGFVVCDRSTHAIQGVVELELGMARRSRHAPPPFLDAALAAAHVPLVRVPVQPDYAIGELRDRVLIGLQPRERPGDAARSVGYFGPAADTGAVGGGVVARLRAERRLDDPDGPGSASAWLPTRGVLVVAALLLIVGAVLSWFVERPTPAPPPPAPAGSAVPPAAPAEPPAPPMPGPPAPAAEAPERPREIVGYRDVRVPGRPLSECMGPDREIGPEVLRCRDGYTKREPIYR